MKDMDCFLELLKKQTNSQALPWPLRAFCNSEAARYSYTERGEGGLAPQQACLHARMSVAGILVQEHCFVCKKLADFFEKLVEFDSAFTQ